MAAGVDYPPFTVPRPVSILLIENEGPEELFAEKLDGAARALPARAQGAARRLHVRLGRLLARRRRAPRAARSREIAEKGYDLVFGDPLDSLGIEGVGSPEDTRKFLALMKQTGLNKTVAWWLNTHPRKEETKEALNEIAGAWGGKPDTRVPAADARGRPDADPAAEAALGAAREGADAPVRVRPGHRGVQLHRRAGGGGARLPGRDPRALLADGRRGGR